MSIRRTWWVIAVFLWISTSPIFGQSAPKPTAQPKLPPPPEDAVAATVNGQPISELAVYRAIIQERPEQRDEARKEVLDFLIENALVDQYLRQLKIEVSDEEIDQQMTQLRKEAKAEGLEFEKILKSLFLTEADLRRELVSSTRWEKFVTKYATKDRLKKLFEQNRDMFNGSAVQAMHILVKNEKSDDAAKKRITSIRKYIDSQVAKAISEVPADADKLTKEKTRIEALNKSFSEAATKYSECPSKQQGGNLGWFRRTGMMVEPFAKAAFALEPFQMSDVVATKFGYHIILTVDRKAGTEVQYDQVKLGVRNVYAQRLREAVLDRVRPNAKISLGK